MSQTDDITTVSPVGKNCCIPLYSQPTSNSITDEDDKGVILNSLSMHDVGRRWPHVARKLSLKMNVVHDIHERSTSTTECYDQVVSVRDTVVITSSPHSLIIRHGWMETLKSRHVLRLAGRSF